MQMIQGDLIKLAEAGQFDVIVHGCNCFCAMGRGIAFSIKNTFPEAHAADKRTVRADRAKLGTCTYAECQTSSGMVHVVNAYTQFHWNGDGVSVLADYEAIRSCMRWVAATYPEKRIGLPKIGAGLARGDWNVIEQIIREEFAGADVTVVELIT